MYLKLVLMIMTTLFCLNIKAICREENQNDGMTFFIGSKDMEVPIDSCVIICYMPLGKVKVSVKPTDQNGQMESYGCRLTPVKSNTPSKDLGFNIGDFIIRSCDSLFVKKTIAPIISTRYNEYINSGEVPEIGFFIYKGGKYLYERYVYAEENGHYTYEYSECFNSLCNMIISDCYEFLYEFQNKYSDMHDSNWKLRTDTVEN